MAAYRLLVVGLLLLAACGETATSGLDAGAPDDAGSGNDAGICTAPSMRCGGVCVDVRSDNEHCGTCGHGCGAGKQCAGSFCVPDCTADQTLCGSGAGARCVDLKTDHDFCGSCENACDSDEYCSSSQCEPLCPDATQAYCSGECVDTSHSTDHCGRCGNPCQANEVCHFGECGVACGASEVWCGGHCVNPLADRTFCGAKDSCLGDSDGTQCAPAEVCLNGSCTSDCPGRGVVCGGTCIDPASDPSYCGAKDGCSGATAGRKCSGTDVCSQGICVPFCPAPFVGCQGHCVDPNTDPTHCGADDDCLGGTKCAGADVCVSGSCVADCPVGEIVCDGRCVDPRSSTAFCGASGSCAGASGGIACAPGERCDDGVCEPCPFPSKKCGGLCVDLQSDEQNCGGCNGSCASGSQCVSGACLPFTCRGERGWPGVPRLMTDAQVRKMATGDLNGDGLPDVAVLTQSYQSPGPVGIDVYFNTGGGHYSPATFVEVSGIPDDLVIADVDGDKDADLVTVGRSIIAYFNTGVGTFLSPVELVANVEAHELQAADLNQDGLTDLVVNGDEISVLLNTGAAGFGARTALANTKNRSQILLADMNGDGVADIVSPSYSAWDIKVYVNSGAGAFTLWGTVPLTTDAADVAVGDFDGDGSRDIAAAAHQFVKVFLNAGAGAFTAGASYTTSNAIAVAAGDWNGDRKADLAVGERQSSLLHVLVNTGSGTMTLSEDISVAAPQRMLKSTDLNGDGRADLLIGNDGNGSNQVTPVLGRGDGTFAAGKPALQAPASFALTIDDFNGDNLPDVAASGDSDSVSIWLGTGQGTFGAVNTYAHNLAQGHLLTSGDVNGDGKKDLAVTYRTSAVTRVLLNDGHGAFAVENKDYKAGGGYPTSIVLSDLNADGKADLVATNRQGAGVLNRSVRVWLSNSGATYSNPVDYETALTPQVVRAGDLNGDTVPDLVVVSSEQNGSVSVLLNDGSGAFGTATNYPAGSYATGVVVGDFNADGRPDLAVESQFGHALLVYQNSGQGTFNGAVELAIPKVKYQFGGSGAMAATDVNGDGALDIVVADGLVFLNDGKGGFRWWGEFGAGAGAFGDFNGDGLPDAAEIGGDRIDISTGSCTP